MEVLDSAQHDYPIKEVLLHLQRESPMQLQRLLQSQGFFLAQNNSAFQALLTAKYKVQSHFKASVMLKA
jgi:hypothetical protein